MRRHIVDERRGWQIASEMPGWPIVSREDMKLSRGAEGQIASTRGAPKILCSNLWKTNGKGTAAPWSAVHVNSTFMVTKNL
jgi:hypothetical protein